MEFGKLELQELETADLSLPPDPPHTAKVLSKGKGKTKFYIGCAKWGRKDWIGKLYPPGTKEKDFLKEYAKHFNAIEFNGFFYNLQSVETIHKWKAAVPDGFKFCPKFTQSITHYKRLKDAEADVDAYLAVVHEFGEHLGPIFLMPNPQMNTAQLGVIEKFIDDIPKDIDLFLELRHPSWYAGGYNPDLLKYLTKAKRGTVITDAAGRRDCAHMEQTTPECFIRFVGNSLHKSDYTRIDDWVTRIGEWMKEGLESCYFFMHQHEELHSPELIKYFIEQMNGRNGTDIPPVKMQNDGGLF